MFGYVRPYRPELRVKEFEAYRACYCGVCHALGHGYGFASRFIVSFDAAFLAMLTFGTEQPEFKVRRCVMCPFRGRAVCTANKAIDMSAGLSVILTHHKLRDSIADSGFLRSLPARFAGLVLARAYKKALKKYPEYDAVCREELKALAALEKENTPSADAAADRFARITQAASLIDEDGTERRIDARLLYQLGRWIYITDALDDLKKDVKNNNYNPLRARLSDAAAELSEDQKNAVKETLLCSVNDMGAALELKDETFWSEILRNTLYLGLCDTADRVADGTFDNSRRGMHGR